MPGIFDLSGDACSAVFLSRFLQFVFTQAGFEASKMPQFRFRSSLVRTSLHFLMCWMESAPSTREVAVMLAPGRVDPCPSSLQDGSFAFNSSNERRWISPWSSYGFEVPRNASSVQTSNSSKSNSASESKRQLVNSRHCVVSCSYSASRNTRPALNAVFHTRWAHQLSLSHASANKDTGHGTSPPCSILRRKVARYSRSAVDPWPRNVNGWLARVHANH